jgi:hypothetical protein
MPNFKKQGRGFKMKYGKDRSPFNFGKGTGGDSPFNKNGGNDDVLAALRAQLLTTKAPAKRASIQKKIDEIIASQKRTASPGPSRSGYMTRNAGPGPSPGQYREGPQRPRM